MKKPLATFIGAVIFSTTLPVLAGPNWALIEDGRKAQAARMDQGSSKEATSQQDSKNAKMQKMMKECREMMNKG